MYRARLTDTNRGKALNGWVFSGTIPSAITESNEPDKAKFADLMTLAYSLHFSTNLTDQLVWCY